jgi:hypothetical protein
VPLEDALPEIFAAHVLPGVRHPDLINDQPRVIADSLVVPEKLRHLSTKKPQHSADQELPQ